MSEGKVAVVTGASRGIGKGIAIEMAKAGLDVVIAARTVEKKDSEWPGTIHETADLIRQEGRRALPVKVDVTNMDDVRNLVAQTMKEFGRIDVMVNNAQYVGPGHLSMFVDTEWEDLENRVKGNVTGTLLIHHLCVPIMIKQGGGMFINIASGSGHRENPFLPGQGGTALAYGVTKAAFNRIALGLAKEVQQHNIAVMNLSPGYTLTERLMAQGSMGFDLSQGHSVRVPGVAAAYLATCRNPMYFNGKYLESKDLVQKFGLMTQEDLASPWEGGQTGISDWQPGKEAGRLQ